MKQIDEQEPEKDSDSSSQELQQNELANMNKYFKQRKNHRGRKVTQETQALYKQALMDAIFGKFEQASKKLKYIITITPDNPEPYHLLGNMHEQNQQYDKAVEYLFMSTYLSPPSLEKWIKVADISFQLKMYNQAAYCYGRALKIEHYNMPTMIKRAQAFELSSQFKKAILMYKKILNITKSYQIVKKYAKLRFKRGEYLICREILINYCEEYIQNQQIVYMICETYLKEGKYEQIIDLIKEHFDKLQKDKSLGQIMENQLPIEFLKMIFICCVLLDIPFTNKFDQAWLFTQLEDSYEEDYSDFYKDIRDQLKSKNQKYFIKIVELMLKHEVHQTLENYLFVIDYYSKVNKSQDKCVKYLEEAKVHFPCSKELQTEQSYIQNVFGRCKSYGMFKKKKYSEDIFYSDQDQPFSLNEQIYNQNSLRETPQKIVNGKRQSKTKPIEVQDPIILNKLLQNSSSSLQTILKSLQTIQDNKAGYYFDQVSSAVDLLLDLSQNHQRQKVEEREEKDGLYFTSIQRKHMIENGNVKQSFIKNSLKQILEHNQLVLKYLIQLMKQKQFRKINQICQKLSKAQFFKIHNKREQYKLLKIKIFQISLLSCLYLKKINSGIFYIRFLINREPNNQLYLVILHYIMKNCQRSNFISSMLNKYADEKQKIQNLTYLLGIEYMENGCFDIAINNLIKVSQTKDQTLQKNIYLCLSSCLLQIASGRNTFNKNDFTNRSAICLKKYSQNMEQKPQVIFNQGRWFAQIKLNIKAVQCFKKVLEMEIVDNLKIKAAYNLMVIYKNMENFQEVEKLSLRYFPL